MVHANFVGAKSAQADFVIQSILIPKDKYSLDEAIQYVKDNYKFKKVDIPQSTAFYRFRQMGPRYIKEKLGLKNVKTVIDKKTGIRKIIYYSESDS
jgi:hypothetical protein